MVLSGAVLLGWQYFFPAAPPTPSDTTEKIVKGETTQKLKSSDDKTEKTEKTEPKKVVEKTGDPAVVLKTHPATKHTLVANSVTIETSSMDASVLTANIIAPTQYQKAKNLLKGLDELTKIKPFSLKFENEFKVCPGPWRFFSQSSAGFYRSTIC